VSSYLWASIFDKEKYDMIFPNAFKRYSQI